ncbi:MAG TPA: ribosome-associated translation inhibitor RaiA [Candidatus Saccharibacteria bacterium]|nr:ribosome-associated translation inhibitor RaiA [Candidatus Saccharibacteria bacterium]HRK94353.1 ribosome-associated translation inhibitor RaiA [Candidatus Saccharibacteria bacterium]
MIQSIAITGVKYDVDDTTKKYVVRKIGRLDKYLPRHARKSVKAEVKLKQVNRDHGEKYEAEIILHVPDKQLTAKDSTMNMLAAVDIVEAKIINQLRKYKELHVGHIGRTRAALSKFKRSYAREQD